MVLLALLIGGGIGYTIKPSPQPVSTNVHQMPDGSMMNDTMHAMNAQLIGKSGDAFDAAFINEMIVHHQGAVEMAQLALNNAHHQEIKDLAQAIIAAQTKEIGDMQAWYTNWYGNN